MKKTKKFKILKQVTVNGHSVRVIRWNPDGSKAQENRFQAQARMSHQAQFENFGPEAETEDHAFYWAFESIFSFFQDKHQVEVSFG